MRACAREGFSRLIRSDDGGGGGDLAGSPA
jgi:hypothetical protein